MKLTRFALMDDPEPRLGVQTPIGIIDATDVLIAHCRYLGRQYPILNSSLKMLLDRGAEILTRLKYAIDWALSQDPTPDAFLFHPEDVHILAPIDDPQKIICIGQNYRDHCKEQNVPEPKSAIVFAKFVTAIQNPGGPIVHPVITQKLDYEAELGVVIGKGGRHIPEEQALDHVGGYMNLNDVTARDLQKSDGQWIRAKSCDTFAPIGPYLLTADEVPDPQNLNIQCRVNGEVVQKSNTEQMIFTVAYLVSFLSQFVTLAPGDVIATGTPPGVGCYRNPPRFLKAGDEVEVEIEGLGILRNPVVNP